MELRFLSDLEYGVSGLAVSDILKQRYCVFDFEATGINHDTEHIIQIGAVIIENGRILETSTFTSYVRPVKPIPEAIERLTGIYNAYVERAPRFNEVYSGFIEFIKDSVLVTHAGYEFDMPLLRNECKRFNLPMMDI
ncbi:3'-5' exonuclease [Paenibacillus lautus]|uniref:3'-5' exonuclease n=1 Tax=Paenibacillus lautus TaxID=1401 RepID=UPI003D2B102A